jgi:hypothetical protein
MYTLGHALSGRQSRTILYLTVLLAVLLLSGCAAAKQELASAQAEAVQVRDQLTTAQAEVSARQTEVPQLRQQIATAEAQAKAQHIENEDLTQELADTQAQVRAKESELTDAQKQLADAQKQLAATQAELDDFKFAAEHLLSLAEAALKKEDLKEAQRIADLLAEKHPGTKEADRATEVVKLIGQKIVEREAAEKTRIASATSKMRKETDDVRGVTFYEDKSTTQYNNANSFHLYIGQKDAQEWLRLRIQYAGDDWLFIENYVIKADGQTFDFSPDYSEVERDNGSGGVWEWYDREVTQSDVKMIQAIIASKSTTLRYNGQQYYSDRPITAAEKKALQNVLDAFVALGGDLNKP